MIGGTFDLWFWPLDRIAIAHPLVLVCLPLLITLFLETNNTLHCITLHYTAEIVAVNDPFLTPEYAAYQFKYDSVHGTYPAEVTFADKMLIVGDVKIHFFAERNPAGVYRSSCYCCAVLQCLVCVMLNEGVSFAEESSMAFHSLFFIYLTWK